MKIYIYLFTTFLFFSCQKKKENKLTIAAAANMQFAIKEICKNFTNTTGIECNIILASSGKLTSQIKQGAPYDIFMSANLKYPFNLHNDGYTVQKPKTYALGNLVLWSAYDTIIPNIEILKSNQIHHIALANPKTAPYGNAAMDVLRYYKLDSLLKDKLVFGESVSQVNQFVLSKASKIGFSNKSIINKNIGNWMNIPKTVYSPIKQGMVILKHSTHKKNAHLFYDFILSKKGQEILIEYGYSSIL